MSEGSPQTQRRSGFGVVLVLALLVALAQLVAGKRRDTDGIDKGIHALELATTGPREDRQQQLKDAEHAFGASAGTVVIEPQAIIGMELSEQMATALGTPDPVTPEVALLTEQTAAAHAQALMARGKPEAALAYLGRPEVRLRTGRGLAVLARFAERWVVVRGR